MRAATCVGATYIIVASFVVAHAACYMDCRTYTCIGLELGSTCYPIKYQDPGGFISYDHGSAHGKLFCEPNVPNNSKFGILNTATISTCGCDTMVTGASCEANPNVDWAPSNTCDCALSI